jgi:hypothetical protein
MSSLYLCSGASDPVLFDRAQRATRVVSDTTRTLCLVTDAAQQRPFAQQVQTRWTKTAHLSVGSPGLFSVRALINMRVGGNGSTWIYKLLINSSGRAVEERMGRITFYKQLIFAMRPQRSGCCTWLRYEPIS